MAILIEGISVIARCEAIAQKHAGGMNAFRGELPNPSICSDGQLARVGFMSPDAARAYVEQLENRGLEYAPAAAAIDIVVVDQRTGLRAPCDWVAFGTAHWENNPEQLIAVCRAKPDGIPGIYVPAGWKYESSLSATHRFIEADKLPEALKLIRREASVDVYFDEVEGREYYVSRPGG